ncbi:MAG: hypothetical protein P8R54_31010 [Myxococcota bacterium]|nr:hypothetical protein [Myxococcota bacterium]
MIVLLTLLSTAAAEWSWFLVPTAGYDTDDKLGFGVRAEVNEAAAGQSPYRTGVMVQAYATTSGYHNHRIRYDRLGIADTWRLTVYAAWRVWGNDGYWGIGNGTLRSAEVDPQHYRYRLVQPTTHAVVERPVGARWSLFFALKTKWSAVSAAPDSLLAQQQPYGMGGGLMAQGLTGAIFDTRSPVLNPEEGARLEISGRYGPRLSDEGGHFGGPYASARGFTSPAPWVTLGARVMGEWLIGEIPFYEQVQWGGCRPVSGFGGWETIRGVPFGRWRAPGKAVLNTEVRLRLLEHSLRGASVAWQLVPYGDVGAVFGGEGIATADAPELPLHYAVGLGGRVVFDEQFVGRLDVGLGPDPVVVDGAVEEPWGLRMYLVFDHTF